MRVLNLRMTSLAVAMAGTAGVFPADVLAEGWRVETGVTTRAIASDNINFSPTAPSSDTLLELNPSVRVTRKSPRLTLDAAYTPRYLYYTQDTYDSRLSQDFNGSGRFEVIDDFMFIDARAISAQRNQSVFNAVPTDATLAANQLSRTRTYSFTPSFMGTMRLSDVATWRSNYNMVRSETSGLAANTLTSETFHGSLTSYPARLGWKVDVMSNRTESDRSASVNRKSIVGSLIYRPDATADFTVRYGYEDTNFASQRSGSTYGLGMGWNPSERTTFRADYDQRPYARTNNVNLTHRLPRTSFTASYSRNLTNRAEQLLAPTGTTDLVQSLSLIEPFASEPDPVLRQQMIEAYLRANGLSRYVVGLSPILSDRQYLQTRWQMSATRTGPRNTLSLSVFQTESDGGIGAIGPAVGDDFAASRVIRQRGWTATYSHRMGSVSSLSVSFTSSKSDGRTQTLSSDRDVLNTTWSTQFSPRTTGSIGLRMTRATVTAGDVDENAVIATLSTMFN